MKFVNKARPSQRARLQNRIERGGRGVLENSSPRPAGKRIQYNYIFDNQFDNQSKRRHDL